MIHGVSHRDVNEAVAAKVQRECGPGKIKGVSHGDANVAIAAKVRRESDPGILNYVKVQVKGVETGDISELDHLSVEELLAKIPTLDGFKKPEEFRQNTNHNCYATCALKAAKGQYSEQFRADFQKYVQNLIDHPEQRHLYTKPSGYDPNHPDWNLHTNATGQAANGKYYMDPLQEFMEIQMNKSGNGYGNAQEALAYITGKSVKTEGTALSDTDTKNDDKDFWKDASGKDIDRDKFKQYVTNQLDKNKIVIVSHENQKNHHSVIITGYDQTEDKLIIKDSWKDNQYRISPKDAFITGFTGDAIDKGMFTDVTYIE